MHTGPLTHAEINALDAFLDAIADVYRPAMRAWADTEAAWDACDSDDDRHAWAQAESRSDVARASLAWLDGVRKANRASRRVPDGAAWAWARAVVAGCPAKHSRDGFDRIRPLARRWLAALAAGEVSAREVVGGLRIVGSELLEPGEGCGGFRLLDAAGRSKHAAQVAAEALARSERVRAYEARRGLVVPPLARALQLAAAQGGRLLDARTLGRELAVALPVARKRALTPLDRAAFAVNAITGLRMDDALAPWPNMWRGEDTDPGPSKWKRRGRLKSPDVDRRSKGRRAPG